MHTSFQKGLEELGCDASDMITSIHAFFHDWPSRWEDFTEVQKRMKVPQLNFIKHVSSRWLTLQPAAARVLQQWDAIIEYFLKYIPTKATHLMGTVTCKKIVCFLKKKTIKAELCFVVSSASLFSEFTRYFQKEEPLIHLLYEHLKYLLLKLMTRICKSESLNLAQHPGKEMLEAQNLLPPSKIILSEEVLNCLSVIALADKNNFFVCAQKHYIAASRYILNKVQPGSNIQCFRCLQPNRINSAESMKDIMEIVGFLPNKIDSEKLKAEWLLLSSEDKIDAKDDRIDHFWAQVFDLKHLNDDKYPNLAQVVKPSLTLSHGSANVERGFSRSSRVLTEDKASMSVKTLNSRLTVLDGLQSFGNKPECVPITKELLNLARNAHNNYNLYLEKERIRKEEETRKKEIAEKEEAMVKENIRKIEESEKDIEMLKNELKFAKKDEKTHIDKLLMINLSDKLLDEANKRLKKALDSNNFVEAKIAQAIIEGVVKTKEEFKEKRKAVTVLEKRIEKRKDSVITNFFNKKPRN